MIPWFRFERRWRDELCAAAIPRGEDSDLPGYDELDTEEFWQRFEDTAAPTLRRALRVGVWILTAAPLVLTGRPRALSRLTAHDRDACLARSMEHRVHLVRELVSALRLVACMAYFADPDVRAHVVARS